MKKKQKPRTRTKRQNNEARASLAGAIGSGTSYPKTTFEKELADAIDFHMHNPNDPHGIGLAVAVALREVRTSWIRGQNLQ